MSDEDEVFDEDTDDTLEDLDEVEELDEGDDEGTDEEEVDVLDISGLSGKKVAVQVDGETIYVPIEEALSGYSRTADYTRKTQALAEARKELQVAAALYEGLVEDPDNTFPVLMQHFGYGGGGQRDNPEDAFDEDDPLTPLQKQVAAIEQRLALQSAQAELDATMARLTAKYDDLDPDALIAEALKRGSRSPADLETIWRDMTYDAVAEKAKAAKELSKKEADAAKRRKAAKAAGAAVSGGRTPSPSTPIPRAPDPDEDVFRSIWEEAKAELAQRRS